MKNRKEREIIIKLKKYLKLPYKNIDNEILNAIMSNILSDKSIEFTDEEIFQIIKGICYNFLSKYYLNFNIEIVTAEEMKQINKYNNSDVIGLIKENTIYFERETVLAIRNKDIEILRTIMHETHHAKQRYSLECNIINYRNYLVSSEQIIIMEMDKTYYQDNYQLFFDEIEARWEAEFALYDYLQTVAPNILNLVFNDMICIIDECEKEVENIMRKVKGRQYKREELLDKIIKRIPQYISVYPILSFYYNDDGTKIPVGDILLRQGSLYNESQSDTLIRKVHMLDIKVLKNRNGTLGNLNKDLASLFKDDVISLCSLNSELDELRNYLINDLIAKIENTIPQNYTYDIYEEFINKLHSFREKIFSDKIFKKDLSLKIYTLFQNLQSGFHDKTEEKVRKKG